ncbi:MAG: hypothetical protein KDA57_15610 [Planctomycetales bacterium]|nr:hypothetical protein [Planctomycetales bacterium]
MKNSFWTGGAGAYAKGIHEEYQGRLRELRACLKDCQTLFEQREVEHAIAAAKAQFKAKLDGIDDMIF